MNHITLTGNLVDDPLPSREVGDGQKVRSFRIASTQKRGALFIDCECWNGWTLALDRAAKGDPVALTGELLRSEWKDDDGDTRSRIYIRCREVRLLARREGDESA